MEARRFHKSEMRWRPNLDFFFFSFGFLLVQDRTLFWAAVVVVVVVVVVVDFYGIDVERNGNGCLVFFFWFDPSNGMRNIGTRFVETSLTAIERNGICL